MPALTDTQLRALARLGALARLKELEDEAAAIRRAFPGLKNPNAATDSAAPTASAKPAKRKKRTRNVSPEVRRAAAERMKAYWAKKRAEKAATAEGAENAPATPAAAKKTAAKARAKRARGKKVS